MFFFFPESLHRRIPEMMRHIHVGICYRLGSNENGNSEAAPVFPSDGNNVYRRRHNHLLG